MTEWLSAGWKFLIIRGVVGIAFGVMVIVWPDITILALVVVWGVWALLDGVGSLAQAFQRGSSGGRRVLLVVMGIIALIAAIFAISNPFSAAAVLTWIIGIWLIVRGLFELFGAFSSARPAPRWLLLLSAAFSLVIGILCVGHPATMTFAFVIWLGIMAIAWGVAFLVAGLVSRRELRGLDEAMPAGGAAL